MRKKIDVMLCICFLIGMLLGCGRESNLMEDSSATTFEGSSEPEIADAAEDELIREDNVEDSLDILDENLKPVSLYVANRELWEPKEGSGYCYAWSDIDGNGQPELLIAKQPDEGIGYEIHIFMIEEDGNGIQDVSASGGGSIQADSLPVNDIYRDHSTGVLYYSGENTYFYYEYSRMVQRNRFCKEEDSVYYDSDGNEITYARWQNLKTAFAQGKILSAEKLVWADLNIQSGHFLLSLFMESGMNQKIRMQSQRVPIKGFVMDI